MPNGLSVNNDGENKPAVPKELMQPSEVLRAASKASSLSPFQKAIWIHLKDGIVLLNDLEVKTTFVKYSTACQG